LTGSWQKDTPSSATMNWNLRHKTDWNGVITTRTCQLRQRTQKKTATVKDCALAVTV